MLGYFTTEKTGGITSKPPMIVAETARAIVRELERDIELAPGAVVITTANIMVEACGYLVSHYEGIGDGLRKKGRSVTIKKHDGLIYVALSLSSAADQVSTWILSSNAPGTCSDCHRTSCTQCSELEVITRSYP